MQYDDHFSLTPVPYHRVIICICLCVVGTHSLIIENFRDISASGSLHLLLLLLLGTLLPQISAWLAPSVPSSLCLNVTSPGRSSLAFETPPHFTLRALLPCLFSTALIPSTTSFLLLIVFLSLLDCYLQEGREFLSVLFTAFILITQIGTWLKI